MKNTVSRSEFARMVGVSPGAVTKACKKALAPATVGKRIDCDHPAAIKYLQRRDGTTTTVNGWSARNEAEKKKALEALKNESFAHMTLREIIAKFGTDTGFGDWLRAVKLIEDINEKRLKNEHTMGELVSRQLVKNHLITPFDTALNKLLTDGTKTIARRVISMSEAGRPLDECEKLIADQISSQIKRMKSETVRRLKNV